MSRTMDADVFRLLGWFRVSDNDYKYFGSTGLWSLAEIPPYSTDLTLALVACVDLFPAQRIVLERNNKKWRASINLPHREASATDYIISDPHDIAAMAVCDAIIKAAAATQAPRYDGQEAES